jgi:hypothetical protein
MSAGCARNTSFVHSFIISCRKRVWGRRRRRREQRCKLPLGRKRAKKELAAKQGGRMKETLGYARAGHREPLFVRRLQKRRLGEHTKQKRRETWESEKEKG